MSLKKLIAESGFGVLLVGAYVFTNGTQQISAATNFKLAQLTVRSQNSFVTEAINESGPAVVTVETQRQVVSRNNLFPPNFFIDPSLERFFNQPKIKKCPNLDCS